MPQTTRFDCSRFKIAVGLLTLLGLSSCGPKPGGEFSTTVRPVDLEVEVNDQRLTLAWKKSGSGTINGYNIYVATEPRAALYPDGGMISELKPVNREPFPGDTEPEDGIEHYDVTELDNSVRYYVSVRVAYPDGSVSAPTKELIAVCGPRGEFELSIRYQSETDGYSLKDNHHVRADATDNDLYYFSRDGVDQLGSPDRLSGFVNQTRFLKLPHHGSLADVKKGVGDSAPVVTDDLVSVAEGDWVLVKTARQTYALLKVLEFQGQGEKRRVSLFFALSTLKGELFF